MATLKRIRCTLQGGGVVGPSVSTFYFDNTATGFPASLQTFFQAIKAGFPDDLTINVPNTGDTINSADGTLAGIWTDSGGSTTVGTATQTWALGSGMRCRWLTAGTRGGRRVIGTTFLVPLASTAFDTTGFVSTTHTSTVQTAGSALVTAQSGKFVVWGKPHSKAAADGTVNPVVSALALSLPTGLRSRRT